MSTTESRQNQVPATMSQKLAWLKRLLADPDLSATAKNIATALFMAHNQTTGRCNPRQEILAAMVGGLSREAVSRAVAKLEAAGYVRTVRTRGASHYVLIIQGPAIPEDDASAANDNAEGASSDSGDCSRCDAAITPDVTPRSHQMCAQDHTELSISTIKRERLNTTGRPAVSEPDVIVIRGLSLPRSAIEGWTLAYPGFNVPSAVAQRAPWALGLPESRRLRALETEIGKLYAVERDRRETIKAEAEARTLAPPKKSRFQI